MPSLKDNVQTLLDCILKNPKQAIATWRQNPEIHYLASHFANIDVAEANQMSEKIQITQHLQNFIDDAKKGKYTDKQEELANALSEVKKQIFIALDNEEIIEYVPSDLQDSQMRRSRVPEEAKRDQISSLQNYKRSESIMHEQDFHKKEPTQIPTYNIKPTSSMLIQNPTIISRNSMNKNNESKQRKTIQIKGSQLMVTIKYLDTKLNIDYQISSKSMKKHLYDYIEMYLKKTQIQVLNPKSTIPIMDDTVYMKSADCGNYSFDPFCDCVQFYISRIDKQIFSNSFKVVDQRPDIIIQAVTDQKQWSKSSNLRGTDRIDQLLKVLCQKKQEDQQTYKRTLDNFVRGHGVKLIRDLFEWQKQHYQQMKLKITWVFEMNQIVQRIRDQSGKQVGSQKKKIKKQKQECIKNANSHKILRYVVYKVYGEDQLAKIPKINYENLKNAISIVKKEIINDELLNNLQEYFYQFTHVPKEGQKAPGCSRGLVLFGPPGTGKTELTQALPDLIGFHLISVGLSAADFMKSLVGQSSRMIKDLVNRANLSSHLICSVGIDEVDGLVPDRKDKQQKNKGQGISMLLSVIGGNKDVPNLLFLTSTNHLKKIDQAIRRRLSGQFQVGRPNPQARRKVLEDDLAFLKNDSDMSNFLVKITSNFTGAALKRLNAVLLMKMSKKRVQGKPQKLTRQQIAEGTNQIAKQFSITLGMSTFPQIYQQKTNKKFIFSLKFLNKIAKRFLLVCKQNESFQIYYANQMQKYEFQNGLNRLVKYYQLFRQSIAIDGFDSKLPNFEILKKWIQKSLKDQVIICENQAQTYQMFQRRQNKPTLGLIRDKNKRDNSLKTLFQQNFFSNPPNNLYVIYYVQKPSEIEIIYQKLKWKQAKQKPYSGRVMIELKEEPRMAFQLSTPQNDETKFSFRYFMKTQKQNSPNDVIPQLVQFFTQRKVSYILLIQYQLMLQNAAYDENKMLQVIQQKMGQAINYDKVAVIIHADSLIVLNQSTSDSSMGRSISYSVSDQNMYRLLLNYMKQFALLSKKIKKISNQNQFEVEQTRLKQKEEQKQNKVVEKQKWMAVIVKNPQLAKLLKKDLSWPKTPQQRKQQKEQQQREKKQKICYRCKIRYTQAENQKQRKCAQHPGPLIDLRTKQIEQQVTITKARFEQVKYKKQLGEKKGDWENIYIFACCGKGVNEQGEGLYYHLTKQQFEKGQDELTIQKQQRQDEWNQACEYL